MSKHVKFPKVKMPVKTKTKGIGGGGFNPKRTGKKK